MATFRVSIAWNHRSATAAAISTTDRFSARELFSRNAGWLDHWRGPLFRQHHSASRVEPQCAGIPEDPKRRLTGQAGTPVANIRNRSASHSRINTNSIRRPKCCALTMQVEFDKTNLFFRWADDAQREDQTLGIFATTPLPSVPAIPQEAWLQLVWNLVNVLSPTMTNEFIFTYNHLTQVVDVPQRMRTRAFMTGPSLGFTFTELYPAVNRPKQVSALQLRCRKIAISRGFASGWLSEGKTFAFTDNFTSQCTVLTRSRSASSGTVTTMASSRPGPIRSTSTFGPNRENPTMRTTRLRTLLLGNYTSINQTNGLFYGDFRFYGSRVLWPGQLEGEPKTSPWSSGFAMSYLGPTYTLGEFLEPYFDPALL